MSEAVQPGAEAHTKKPLGARLVDAGLITDAQLDLALREQKRSGVYLGETLVQLGFCTPEAITELLAQENEVEVVDVRSLQLSDELMQRVSYTTCRRFKLIPVRTDGNVLTVALADSFDVVAMDAVEREAGCLVNVATAPEQYILEAIERNYAGGRNINDSLESVLSGSLAEVGEDGDETPMVRLVDEMLGQSIKAGASDIHLHPEEKNVRVRIRWRAEARAASAQGGAERGYGPPQADIGIGYHRETCAPRWSDSNGARWLAYRPSGIDAANESRREHRHACARQRRCVAIPGRSWLLRSRSSALRKGRRPRVRHGSRHRAHR